MFRRNVRLPVTSSSLREISQDAEKDRQRRSRIAQRLNVRPRVRFASSLAAALLYGLFAYPALLSSVVSTLVIRDGYRGQNELFRSLLGV
jgi:hypothetical protein